MGDYDVNAVTWGVFKGKEVVQPTVVDHQAFMIWKDEAFKHWVDDWGFIYGLEAPSCKFLEMAMNKFYLVNIVDNDYVNGDLNKVLLEFIEKNQETISKL